MGVGAGLRRTRVEDGGGVGHRGVVELRAPQRPLQRTLPAEDHPLPDPAGRVSLDLDGRGDDMLLRPPMPLRFPMPHVGSVRRPVDRPAGQEVEGVGERGEDRGEAFHRAPLAAREVQDEGGSARAGDPSRERRQRRRTSAGGSHLLGQARSLAFDHGAGRFGGHVPGAQARPAGGHHQRPPFIGQPAKGGFDPRALVRDDLPAPHVEAGSGQQAGHRATRGVVSNALGDPVAHRHHGRPPALVLHRLSPSARTRPTG